MSLFDNVTWPNNCIFNVAAEKGSKYGGSAEVTITKHYSAEANLVKKVRQTKPEKEEHNLFDF